MTIPFGVFVPQGWRLDLVDISDPVEKYEAMTRVARVAEETGFDSIWLYDHVLTVPTIELETTFECWMSTAGLSRDTERIKVGQMVTCNGYRNPALLAKMASTVDVYEPWSPPLWAWRRLVRGRVACVWLRLPAAP